MDSYGSLRPLRLRLAYKMAKCLHFRGFSILEAAIAPDKSRLGYTSVDGELHGIHFVFNLKPDSWNSKVADRKL